MENGVVYNPAELLGEARWESTTQNRPVCFFRWFCKRNACIFVTCCKCKVYTSKITVQERCFLN